MENEHKKNNHVKGTRRVKKVASRVRRVVPKKVAPAATLEIVLKCDTFGSVEAVAAILNKLHIPGVQIKLIQSGVGTVSKSDLVMALTGSRLVVGFGVDVMPKLEQWIKDNGVEVRLYSVIYRLADDVQKIGLSLIQPDANERNIIGRAQVVALFKSSRRGIILGCEVLEGVIAVGKEFYVVSAMGPVYSSKIESLHIENSSVREAKVGQRVGLKITAFNRAKVGDLVECFESVPVRKRSSWSPSGAVLRFES
ncbi:MAG: hypothetical protein AB2L11_09920 [Syntrophobacteraceae bacterium]